MARCKFFLTMQASMLRMCFRLQVVSLALLREETQSWSHLAAEEERDHAT